METFDTKASRAPPAGPSVLPSRLHPFDVHATVAARPKTMARSPWTAHRETGAADDAVEAIGAICGKLDCSLLAGSRARRIRRRGGADARDAPAPAASFDARPAAAERGAAIHARPRAQGGRTARPRSSAHAAQREQKAHERMRPRVAGDEESRQGCRYRLARIRDPLPHPLACEPEASAKRDSVRGQ